ncbi:helix-turn-helix transcriptional regulator [Methylobacterium iners]|uniref:HTH-type quorum sensing-dependent transcriptional regulator RpaR n=1 Tax=Methylobacterium iners TaxID=418707 RepID=A0ABQ4S5M2_9HYPH|nr:LuxR family transcriptional regulator [Methylobacterium iners]GJD97789.1 HTH-type quorum sensing-dependent transcriptional regulator RpaR [Methylobacterium iners]
MSGKTEDCATRALTFVEELDLCSGQDAVVAAVTDILSEFGFEHFIMTGLPHPTERFEQVVVLKRWPLGWFELYSQRNFVRSDPVIRLCRNTTSPFEWTEAPYNPETEPGAREVMTRAEDFGMARGFSLPIHGANGQEACFSMSGKNLDLSRRTKPAIHLIAMYAFERARQLNLGTSRDVPNPLTKRERETLTWAALGKSSRDTAEILQITERTATAHTVNAMQKLAAANKTQAVVKAMQAKFIRI